MKKHSITVKLNQVETTLEVNPSDLLIDVLRENGLISVKLACDTQICGACTVLISGKPVSACTTLAIEMDGQEVMTVEGLASGNELHPIQQAFMDNGALQCGFCTPGMIMSSVALLEENPNPTEEEIKHYLHGNICRCTGYTTIVDAILQVANGRGTPKDDSENTSKL